MSYYLFLIIAPLIAILFNIYAYKRLIRKIAVLDKFRRFFLVFFILLGFFSVIFLLSLRIFNISLWVYLIGAASFGMSFFLASATLIYDIAVNTTSLIMPKEYDKTRRKFIRMAFDISFIVLSFGLLLRGLFSALRPPAIKEVDVVIDGLCGSLRFAVISDVHIGEFLGDEFMRDIVMRINSQNVDAVFIVGDLLDTPAKYAGGLLDSLKDLRSRYGTFYVTGNHEFYHGAKQIIELLKSYGVYVLQNESVKIGGINLAGVHDIMGKIEGLEPNPHSALAQIDKSLPTIMLAHQPRFVYILDDEGLSNDVDLLICGHTHAGQIFPFSLLVLLQQPYLHGLYQHNDKMQVYVSSGAGFWGPPVRVLAPSEIVILNLKESL